MPINRRSDSIWGGKSASINYHKEQPNFLFELRQYDRNKEKVIINLTEVNFLQNFWKQKTSTHPELYDSVQFVALMAPTQVVVGRTF